LGADIWQPIRVKARLPPAAPLAGPADSFVNPLTILMVDRQPRRGANVTRIKSPMILRL
jgi:hypothetical protein